MGSSTEPIPVRHREAEKEPGPFTPTNEEATEAGFNNVAEYVRRCRNTALKVRYVIVQGSNANRRKDKGRHWHTEIV